MPRNLARQRAIALMVLLVGVAAMAGVLLMPEGGIGGVALSAPMRSALQGVLFFVGFVTIAGGGLTLLFAGPRTPRSSPALERGEPAVARWTVDADTWRAFAQLNDTLDRQQGAVRNIVMHDDLPSTGVEIVVAPDGVCIGTDFYGITSLEPTEGPYWFPGPPLYFEFRMVVHARSIHRWTLRFPIAPGHDDEVARAWTHFTALRPQPPAPDVLRRRRRISLVVAVFGLATFIAGLLLLPRTTGQDRPALLMNTVTLVGLLMALTGAFFAVVWHRTLALHRPR